MSRKAANTIHPIRIQERNQTLSHASIVDRTDEPRYQPLPKHPKPTISVAALTTTPFAARQQQQRRKWQWQHKMSTSAATAHSGMVLRSPVVRAPLAAAAWARNTGERESDLDPVYRATTTTRTRTRTPRRRGAGAQAPKIAPALVVAAVVLCAAALTTPWPGGHFSGKPAAAGIAGAVLPPRLQASKSPSSSSSSSADNIRTAAREYAYFMTATEDYSDWFAGADAATRAIDTELASLPPPPPPPPRPSSRAGDGVRDCEAEAAYERDRGLVEARARHLRLARGEWDDFQATRERLVGALAGAGPQWRAYADDRPVPSSPPSAVWRAAGVGSRRRRRLGGDFFNATTKAAAVDGEKGEEEEKRRDECEDGHREAPRRAALVRSARCVVGELGRTGAELFAAWDPAQTHLRAAAETEGAFVGGLVRRGGGRPRSTVWAAAWTGVALRELQGRMRTLGQRNETMATALEALREGGLGGGGGGEGGEGDDDDSSVENAKELLRAWSEVLMDAQEGVLYMLRRRDVRGRPRGVAGQEGSWEAWKSRNCGSTSCYEAPSAAGDIKRMFGKGNPAAGVAQDEVNWTKSLGGDGTLRVPRGVYEKACCENGVLAHRLKYGSNQLPRQK